VTLRGETANDDGAILLMDRTTQAHQVHLPANEIQGDVKEGEEAENEDMATDDVEGMRVVLLAETVDQDREPEVGVPLVVVEAVHGAAVIDVNEIINVNGDVFPTTGRAEK